MGTYLVRRLLLSLLVLIGVTIVVSGMLQVAGDPVVLMLQDNPTGTQEYDALRHELGLDKPFILQYLDFLVRAAQGDLGESIRFHSSALDIVFDRMPATIELTAAMLFALVIAVPIGILSAVYPNTPVDYVGRLIALAGTVGAHFLDRDRAGHDLRRASPLATRRWAPGTIEPDPSDGHTRPVSDGADCTHAAGVSRRTIDTRLLLDRAKQGHVRTRGRLGDVLATPRFLLSP